jgi:hypothetical protein
MYNGNVVMNFLLFVSKPFRCLSALYESLYTNECGSYFPLVKVSKQNKQWFYEAKAKCRSEKQIRKMIYRKTILTLACTWIVRSNLSTIGCNYIHVYGTKENTSQDESINTLCYTMKSIACTWINHFSNLL